MAKILINTIIHWLNQICLPLFILLNSPKKTWNPPARPLRLAPLARNRASPASPRHAQGEGTLEPSASDTSVIWSLPGLGMGKP